MTTGRLQRRLGALEAESANRLGQVHRVFVPEGLSAAEREAWIADHRASLPPNDLVIYRTIIDWPPKGAQADGACTASGVEEA